LLFALLVTAGAIIAGVATAFTRQLEQARNALARGQTLLAAGEYESAVGTLQQGRSVARRLPFQHGLADELDPQSRRAHLQEGPRAPAGAGRTQALEVLDRAETLLGPGPVLDAERQLYGAAGNRPSPPDPGRKARTRRPGNITPWDGPCCGPG